ncbi:MAG: hypothetical protein V4669_01265 [Pseudomonadota bacterium]
MKLDNKWPRAVAACCFLLALAGCGGGDEREPVTLVYRLEAQDVDASYKAIQKQLKSRGVAPLSLQCGVLEEIEPDDWTPIYLDTPVLLYYRLTAADAAAVRDLGWYAVADDAWRKFYVPPKDCGPLPPLE